MNRQRHSLSISIVVALLRNLLPLKAEMSQSIGFRDVLSLTEVYLDQLFALKSILLPQGVVFVPLLYTFPFMLRIH